MLVLFSIVESKLLVQAGLEKAQRDLLQPPRIRYDSRSFSVRCFISLAYWEGIDFCSFFVCCGTPCFPWCGSESLFYWPFICLKITHIWPSITPLKHYIRNPLDTLKEGELKRKKTIVHCCRSLYLSLHTFVPWSTLCSSWSCLCLWACYREMEDWSGGGLSFFDS